MAPRLNFFDWESRSKVDIKKHSIDRYVRDPSTHGILLAVQTADGRQGAWAPPKWRVPNITYDDWIPAWWNDAVARGEFFVAWNAQFDSELTLWDEGLDGFLSAIPLQQVLCAQAQAESYSLPGKLEKAAEVLRVPVQKDKRGKNLIKLFGDANKPWEPYDKKFQADMAIFKAYAMRDVGSMVGVWERCRPWTGQEWTDYHVIEATNRKGMRFDVEFAKVALTFAAAEMEGLNAELRALTGDDDITLAAAQRKIKWLSGLLEGTTLAECMITTKKTKGVVKQGLSTGKEVQTRLKERLEDHAEYLASEASSGEVVGEDTSGITVEVADAVREFLDILDRGNGVATKKFAKALDVHVDGRIYHQYRCSPTITGRHSSRVVQVDNVVRDALEDPREELEDPAIYAMEVLEGLREDELHEWAVERLGEMAALTTGLEKVNAAERVPFLEERFQLPFQKILARCIRPSIYAEDDAWIVWGDWSAVEARGLPWLAESAEGLHPWVHDEDVYCQEALDIFNLNCTWQELKARAKAGDTEAKYQRLVGKVTVLALGYQGGANALISMARGYDVRMTQEFAERTKRIFRERRPWLTKYWKKLDYASFGAMSSNRKHPAGKLTYERLGRDLWCWLPDGRPIIYPDARVETVYKERFDCEMDVITYRKRFGDGVVRGQLYPGILVENGDQGACASLLRNAQRRVHAQWGDLIGTTHDELRREVQGSREVAEQAARELKALMEDLPPWAAGFPIAADVEFARYYGK